MSPEGDEEGAGEGERARGRLNPRPGLKKAAESRQEGEVAGLENLKKVTKAIGKGGGPEMGRFE